MDAQPQPHPGTAYIYQSNPAVAAAQGQRTAAHEADFFLPYLRPAMRLLDAGCGGGSITVGLAEAVAPGPVVGLDREVFRLVEARYRAYSTDVQNADFLGADLYTLPFPDASFDAVFSHHVLQHVRDPLAALREFHRVLRPGGVVGIRDPDEGATLFAPESPLLIEARELEMRLRRHFGGDPTYARNQRALLLDAGFVRPEAQAAVQAWGTPSLARESAVGWLRRLAGPSGGATLVALGWISSDRLAAIEDEITAWGERPDAFSAMTFCSAVAWRDTR
jgi:SAM-dependent methyltransferase